MQTVHSGEIDAFSALARLEAILNGDKLPEEIDFQIMPAAEEKVAMSLTLIEAPAMQTAAPPAPLAVASPQKQRRGRFVGVLTMLVGLGVLGAAWAADANWGNFAASAATVTAKIGQRLASIP